MDTALAQVNLKSLDPLTGAIVPPNLVSDRFVHFSTDNIDILDASFDGKNTFHATQWLLGRGVLLQKLTFCTQPSHEQSIVPEELTTNLPPQTPVSYPEPKFHDDVQLGFTEGGVIRIHTKC